MTISVGDKLPDVEPQTTNADGPSGVVSEDILMVADVDGCGIETTTCSNLLTEL